MSGLSTPRPNAFVASRRSPSSGARRGEPVVDALLLRGVEPAVVDADLALGDLPAQPVRQALQVADEGEVDDARARGFGGDLPDVSDAIVVVPDLDHLQVEVHALAEIREQRHLVRVVAEHRADVVAHGARGRRREGERRRVAEGLPEAPDAGGRRVAGRGPTSRCSAPRRRRGASRGAVSSAAATNSGLSMRSGVT